MPGFCNFMIYGRIGINLFFECTFGNFYAQADSQFKSDSDGLLTAKGHLGTGRSRDWAGG